MGHRLPAQPDGAVASEDVSPVPERQDVQSEAEGPVHESQPAVQAEQIYEYNITFKI